MLILLRFVVTWSTQETIVSLVHFNKELVPWIHAPDFFAKKVSELSKIISTINTSFEKIRMKKAKIRGKLTFWYLYGNIKFV